MSTVLPQPPIPVQRKLTGLTECLVRQGHGLVNAAYREGIRMLHFFARLFLLPVNHVPEPSPRPEPPLSPPPVPGPRPYPPDSPPGQPMPDPTPQPTPDPAPGPSGPPDVPPPIRAER